jgi:hypothetical protein
VGKIVAQVAQGSDTIGYRLVAGGVIKAARISHEVNAFNCCLVKAA